MKATDLFVDRTVSFVLGHVPPPPARVLEVGCGDGAIATRLQQHGYDVVAIDESTESVQRARASGVDARVAGWPDFTDDPFDAILFVRVLHHIRPLAAGVERALRLLRPAGLVIVDEFAWTEIDRPTAAWFYGLVRLLGRCNTFATAEGGFVTDLVDSGGNFDFWQRSHGHDLHTVEAMWSELRSHFETISETRVPHLYRYLGPVVAENDEGRTIVAEVLDMEERLARLGSIRLVGRRFVGKRHPGG